MKTKIIVAVLLVTAGLVGSYYLLFYKSIKPVQENDVITNQAQTAGLQTENTISISIQVSPVQAGTINYSVISKAGTSLADIMKELATNNKDFAYQTQTASFGEFITSINGVKADSTKEFWNIKVNGTDSQVGISDLKPVNNDVITFSLQNF